MSTSTASAAAGFFRRKAGSGVGGADTAASDHNYPSHVVGPVTRSSSGTLKTKEFWSFIWLKNSF